MSGPPSASVWHVNIDTQQKETAARRFTTLAWTILRSCRRDADLSVNLCVSAEAWRLNLTSEVLSLRSSCAFSQFAFGFRVSDQPVSRAESADMSLAEKEVAASRASTNAMVHILECAAGNKEIMDYAHKLVRPAIDTILADWQQFADRLRTGESYATVTMEEKAAIARAVTLAEWGETKI